MVELWRIFLFICTGVFGLVIAALAYALWRAPRLRGRHAPDLRMGEGPDAAPRRSIATAVTAGVLLLLVLAVAGVFTGRALARLPLKDAVNIEVVAHQWWWAVKYVDGPARETFETANEIHVPVGRPVVVKLDADDVIHSLSIPGLAGTKDLIPGRTAVLAFQADKPGLYRGQCAEFCGSDPGLMALDIHAHEPAAYEAWRRRQLGTPRPAAQAHLQRGRAAR